MNKTNVVQFFDAKMLTAAILTKLIYYNNWKQISVEQGALPKFLIGTEYVYPHELFLSYTGYFDYDKPDMTDIEEYFYSKITQYGQNLGNKKVAFTMRPISYEIDINEKTICCFTGVSMLQVYSPVVEIKTYNDDTNAVTQYINFN